MNISNNRLCGENSQTVWMWVTLVAVSLLMAACGGGSGASTTTNEPPIAVQCNPGDPSTAAECGTLLVGLTDADGDFLSYAVNVLSLQLEKADGTTVETLPNNTRIDVRST